MKVRKITINIEEFDKDEKLPSSDEKLIKHANSVMLHSYSPYSEFQVGAALQLSNGELVLGSNQENAAYPSGLCAERVALFYSKSQFPDAEVESIAITASTKHFKVDYPITPCGSCRQVIAETEARQNKKIRIIMRGQGGKTQIVEGIESLLPLTFKEENLKRSKLKK